MSVTMQRVRLKDIRPNPDNPRRELTGLEDLAASIRAHGILQPLLLTRSAGALVLVDGHRRHAAGLIAAHESAVCFVFEDLSRAEVMAKMVATANSRSLEPIEQATAFARMREQGLSTAEIAKAVGLSSATVRERLILLTLPGEVRDMVARKEIPARDAVEAARSLRRRGTVKIADRKSRHLAAGHPLAAAASACTHRTERVMVGGVACGQCWEAAIRADALTRALPLGA